MTRGLRQFLDGLGALAPSERSRAAATTAKAWATELAAGQHVDLATVVKPLPAGPMAAEMVWVRDLPFVSICPHHLLPVRGIAHLAYEPVAHLAPFGQLSRLVELAGARLVLQEDMVDLVVSALWKSLAPRGVACLLVGAHDCMQVRGPRSRDAKVRVLAARGTLAGPPWRHRLSAMLDGSERR